MAKQHLFEIAAKIAVLILRPAVEIQQFSTYPADAGMSTCGYREWNRDPRTSSSAQTALGWGMRP